MIKKGSQQMMNTPGGEGGGQAGPRAREELSWKGLHSVGPWIVAAGPSPGLGTCTSTQTGVHPTHPLCPT